MTYPTIACSSPKATARNSIYIPSMRLCSLKPSASSSRVSMSAPDGTKRSAEWWPTTKSNLRLRAKKVLLDKRRKWCLTAWVPVSSTKGQDKWWKIAYWAPNLSIWAPWQTFLSFWANKTINWTTKSRYQRTHWVRWQATLTDCKSLLVQMSNSNLFQLAWLKPNRLPLKFVRNKSRALSICAK